MTNIAIAVIIVLSVAVGPVSVFWVVLGELFPHSARGAGFSVAILCASIGFTTHNYALPAMLEVMHAYTFFVFAGIDAAVAVFCIFYLPETRDKTFAEIAETWSKPGDESPRKESKDVLQTVAHIQTSDQAVTTRDCHSNNNYNMGTNKLSFDTQL